MVALGALGVALFRAPADPERSGHQPAHRHRRPRPLAARLDAVSAVMLVLVTFVGWVVLRFAATYMDGEARQGSSPAGSARRSRP
jgi:NADH:ubiquinone oxidoreductase subunit 5 (subunit L)/multisubunit Na+/H+ antiporter MnhA subunit